MRTLPFEYAVRNLGRSPLRLFISVTGSVLVVVLAVLRALEHADIQTEADVLFIGNVGEEGLGDLRGVKHLFRDGADPIDTLIAVDGGRSIGW